MTALQTRPAQPGSPSHPGERRARRQPPRRIPRPPRRPPPKPVVLQPMSTAQVALRSSVIVLAALILAFVLDVMVLSQVQHFVSQQQLLNTFRAELAAGTAPVSEGDFNDVLLADGAPVAVIDIPEVGVHEVVVEGTNAPTLMSGPGHRRDTVLPGQAGQSVIMGRAAAYGGPFSGIQQLGPGDQFTVTTGQGKQTFSVIGVRYAGDPVLAAPAANQSRLTLVTARGAPFVPSGVAYVDAQLVSEVQADGARQTTPATLPPEDQALATDTSTVWALVFALQFLIAVEVAAVWAYRRIGAAKTWVVFVPASVLAALFVATEVAVLLPNLL